MKIIKEARYYRGLRGGRCISILYDDSGLSGLEEQMMPYLADWLSVGNSILPAHPKGYPNHTNRLAYQDHPELEQPADEAKLWRYMGFDQFVGMLAEQSLWFSRVTSFRASDPFEGRLPKMNLRKTPLERMAAIFGDGVGSDQVASFERSHALIHQTHLLNLVCCFNHARHESNAMWNVYGKGANCVAVASTLGNLKKAFGPFVDYDVYIGRIKYIDYDVAELSEKNYLWPLVHKAPFYEYENEIRCLIHDDGDICLFDRSEPAPLDIAEAMGKGSPIRFSPGANVPVNLKQLIQEVVIGPFAAPWFKSTVEKVLEQFQLDVPVVSSSLRGEW